jgi:hypothetical protein
MLSAIMCLAVDLVSDGQITTADVQRAVSCVQSGIVATCDFNGDGIANVVDVQIVVNLLGCAPGCALVEPGGGFAGVTLTDLQANEYGTWTGQLYDGARYSWAMPGPAWHGYYVSACTALGCVVCEAD